MGILERARALDDRYVRPAADRPVPVAPGRRNRANLIGFAAVALVFVSMMVPELMPSWWWQSAPLLLMLAFWGGMAYLLYGFISSAAERGARRALAAHLAEHHSEAPVPPQAPIA